MTEDTTKRMTMMKLGELHCFDEAQRIMILEMVKDGSITMDDAIEEVKATNPTTFEGLKYLGSWASAAHSLRASLSEEHGQEAIKQALAGLKKETPRKTSLTVSTVGLRIVDETNNDTIENEPMPMMAYAGLCPGDKKKVAYVMSYSRLGCVFAHIFACAKAKDAASLLTCILERKEDTKAKSSRATRSRIDSMSAGYEAAADSASAAEEGEDMADSGTLGLFHLRYLGSAPAEGENGEQVVVDSVREMRDNMKLDKKSSKRKLEAGGGTGTPCLLVVSSEGLRVIDESSRDVMHNIMIKAIIFSTEVKGKKFEIFAFISVDDRRDTKECHVFLCDSGIKGEAIVICKVLGEAFAIAVKEAKARRGNPFLPIGKIRERTDGPLSALQFPRRNLKAIKAIGAGQFGRVFLALDETSDTTYAVKMLRGAASAEDKTVFLAEAETMLGIDTQGSEHLVKFMGVAFAQRPWLVVLEFCQYGDLSDVLKACTKKRIMLTRQESLYIASCIARGMEYLHSKQYVHMDLAARNCLLDSNNNVKIADFGLTHKYDSGHKYYRQQGVLKLSIRWLAIDSFDYKIFSEKSDVWSWAVTMWEVWKGGRQPYGGKKLQEVLRFCRGGGRLAKPAMCMPDFWVLMESCWQKEPASRPDFSSIVKQIDFLCTKHPGDVRDIGGLLNPKLSGSVKRLSVRTKRKSQRRKKRSSTETEPKAGPEAAEGEPEPEDEKVDEGDRGIGLIEDEAADSSFDPKHVVVIEDD